MAWEDLASERLGPTALAHEPGRARAARLNEEEAGSSREQALNESPTRRLEPSTPKRAWLGEKQERDGEQAPGQRGGNWCRAPRL
jgi:hypothetical protein